MSSQRSMLLDVNREPTDEELAFLMHEVGESVRADSKTNSEQYQKMLMDLCAREIVKSSSHESSN